MRCHVGSRATPRSPWLRRARTLVQLEPQLGRVRVSRQNHFFRSDDLELDLRPEEVASEERFAALSGLMEGLGRLVGKTVVLTYQNGRDDAVFVEFRPGDGGPTYYRPKWR